MIPKPNMANIAKAQDKTAAAVTEMLKNPMWMIEQILRKHETAVIEVMREQQEEIERLREGLRLIECEPINAEYMARNILDGLPAYHDTMIKVGAGGTEAE